MANAFNELLKDHTKVVIIGSDCPKISPPIILSAYDALETSDVVIGPTFDGGYYLLGMKSPQPFLFENIVWSSESVYEKTISNMDKKGLNYAVIKKLSDVDFKKDWDDYGWPLE
ncbi:MAG: TIGR04282 family arsenosugar biosynthesis glycosyltransferase [Saprospiraceae bacterium]